MMNLQEFHGHTWISGVGEAFVQATFPPNLGLSSYLSIQGVQKQNTETSKQGTRRGLSTKGLGSFVNL